MLDADCEEEIALDTDVDEDFDCVSMADSAVSSSAESVASVSACSISVVDLVNHFIQNTCYVTHFLFNIVFMISNMICLNSYLSTHQMDSITHSSATPRWILSSATDAPGRTRGCPASTVST